MQPIVILMMFIAWLLYGTMPALGAHGGMASPAIEGSAAVVHDQVAHPSHHQTKEAVFEHAAKHESSTSKSPCPQGAINCVTASCAACLTILPGPPQVEDHLPYQAHEGALPEVTVLFPTPAPLTPPPRN